MIAPEQRFWSRVRKTDLCWLWLGTKTQKGYGRLIVGYRVWPAHRYAYELLVGTVPAGLQLDHLCRNRACVNPQHLEPVTGKENTLRGFSPAAQNARKLRCKNGHPFDIVTKNRTRQCSTCIRRRVAQWTARNRERVRERLKIYARRNREWITNHHRRWRQRRRELGLRAS